MHLESNSIGNRALQKFCDVLRLNSSLKVLNLRDNVFDEEGANGFTEMLRVNNTLRVVDLSHTRVPATVQEAITQACNFNREPPQVKVVYYRLVDNDRTLTQIDLSANKRQWALDDYSVQSLCSSMKGKKFVTHVNFSGNTIGTNGCKCLSQMLSDVNCGVTVLNLTDNPINDEAVNELCRCVHVNTSLK